MTRQATTASATARFLIVALCAGLALAGCGRKAPLDRPGVAAEPQQQEETDALAGAFGQSGDDDEDVPPLEPNRRFILDPLLD